MNTGLHITAVRLRVTNLARSLDFYTQQLGFAVTTRGPGTVSLAVAPGSPDLLMLVADPTARRASPRTAGLFHAAFLLPSRAALGRWLHHAAKAGVTFDGFSDHGVSEAIYLSDPDGTGLEFYADRPREQWPFAHGELAMVTHPLRVPDLLAAASPSVESLLAGARWGHLHLRVRDLDRAQDFYATTLGLSLTQRFGDSARFLAADGYHHHLGLNTWGGVHEPQLPGEVGLIDATFALPSAKDARDRRDPDGIALRITPAALA